MSQLLNQAKEAIEQKNQPQARQLLQQAIQQTPQDYRPYLWLASIAPTPQESLLLIQQAETLQPNNPTIQRARAWAEKKLPDSPPIPPTVKKRAIWPIATIFGLIIMVLMGGLWWLSLQGTVTAVSITPSPTDNNVVAQIQPETVQEPATATPSPLPPTQHPPTATPQQLVSKKVIAQNNVRATWTPTPLPSPTPSPTPSPIPTFISASNTRPNTRPWGVGPLERWVDVDLTRQLLSAYEGDTLIYQTYISSGTWEHPTVTGQFRVWLRYESQTMNGRLLGYDYYLEDVPYVMYFYEDYALHGAYWHNNFGNPMSHGCVNLHPTDAEWLFYFTSMGTLVNVHY